MLVDLVVCRAGADAAGTLELLGRFKVDRDLVGAALVMHVQVGAHERAKRIKPIIGRPLGRLRFGLVLFRLSPIVDTLLAQRPADGLKVVDDRRHGFTPAASVSPEASYRRQL
jgi:hypothetical protein